MEAASSAGEGVSANQSRGIPRGRAPDVRRYVSTPPGRHDPVVKEPAGKNAFSHTIGLTAIGPCNSRRSNAR
jgi:hypothetical protein